MRLDLITVICASIASAYYALTTSKVFVQVSVMAQLMPQEPLIVHVTQTTDDRRLINYARYVIIIVEHVRQIQYPTMKNVAFARRAAR